MTEKKQSIEQPLMSEMVAALMAVVDESNPSIKAHSERVAGLCVGFAKHMNQSHRGVEVEKIYLAGLLHDIGKICNNTATAEEEISSSKDSKNLDDPSPLVTERILSHISGFRDILPFVRHYREAINGSGFPDGLRGMKIPIEARIIGMVDTYDTLAVPADADKPNDTEKALNTLRSESGKVFDRHLVKAFEQFIEANGNDTADDDLEPSSQSLREIFLEVANQFKKGAIDLPVLPKVANDIEKVVKKVTSTTTDVANVVEKDAVISLKLISISNSPIYRGVEKITEVRTAISRLGIKETQNVVSAIAQKSLYSSNNRHFKQLLEKLWAHSLACAYGASVIAKHLDMDDSEMLFLVGLVHDIGQTFLVSALSDKLLTATDVDMDEVKAGIAEIHAGFTRALLNRWKFEKRFVKLATMHVGPDFGDQTDKGVLVVNLASHLAENIGFSPFDEAEVELSTLDSTVRLGVDTDALVDIGEEIRNIMQKAAHLF